MEFFDDSCLHGVLGVNSVWLPKQQTWATFFNLHKCKMAMDRYRSCLILELLVPTSSVIPRLRVVWFVESNCNVSFLSQGQCIALKVKECQV